MRHDSGGSEKKVYAYKAKDAALVREVVEIRKRAERRLGQLMDELRKAGRLAKPGDYRKRVSEKPVPPPLARQGIDKNLADRARKAAAMTEEQFRAAIARAIKIAIASIESAQWLRLRRRTAGSTK
jgi:hypothetical protein